MRTTLFIASLIVCSTLLVGCSFLAAEQSPSDQPAGDPPTVVDPFDEPEEVEEVEEEPETEDTIPVKPAEEVEEEPAEEEAPPALVIGGTPTVSQEVLLAQCLTESGAKLYTAEWCGHCQKQKEAFKDGAEYLDNTECAADEGWATVCTNAGVSAVPTWIFGDGEKATGNTPLTTLASKSGCTYEVSS